VPQAEVGRRWTPPPINWTLPWRRSSESVFFELRPGRKRNIRHAGAAGAELISLRVLINKPALTPEPLPEREADETAGKAVHRRSEKGKISLEAIRCQQRSTLGKGTAHEERQNRGCSGSTELAIVVSRRSRREISLWKAGDRHKERKEEQKDRKASGHCGRKLWVTGHLLFLLVRGLT